MDEHTSSDTGASRPKGRTLLAGPIMSELWSIAQYLVVRGSGVGATFIIGVLISRLYGTSVNGLFQVGVAYLTLMAAVARLGQDQLNLRRMAELKAREDRRSAHHEMRLSLRAAAAAAVLATAALAIGPFLGSSTSEAPLLATFAFAVAPLTLLWIATEGLRGWQSVLASIFWQGVFVPVLFCLALASMYWSTAVPTLMLPIIYAACITLAFVGAQIAWRRSLAHHNPAAPDVAISRPDLCRQIRQGRNFWFLAVLSNVAGWLDLLMLYAVADARQVGVFFAIVRTGGLIAVALNIAATGVIARLAYLYADRRMAEFVRTLKLYWILFVAGTVLAVIAFVVFMQPLLLIWGADIQSYRTEFLLYLAVQAVQALFILAQLAAGVVGLERRLIGVQLVMVPFKAVAIYLGYTSAGLLGAICGVGIAMVITAMWTSVLFLRRLSRHGVSIRTMERES